MRLNTVRGQSRSERTDTAAGQSNADFTNFLVDRRPADTIGTLRGLRGRAGLVRMPIKFDPGTPWIRRARADAGARGSKHEVPCLPQLSPRIDER